MEAQKRRTAILIQLQKQQKPVSASVLAGQFGVSRQVIVGDIALLRAQGEDILATARGYTLPSAAAGRYLGKIACLHSLEDTEAELLTIVNLGGTVQDVIVEHNLYGEITGQLGIESAQDARAFAGRICRSDTRLLSELTGGIHLHTISCRNIIAFESIRLALAQQGFLYNE